MCERENNLIFFSLPFIGERKLIQIYFHPRLLDREFYLGIFSLPFIGERK